MRLEKFRENKYELLRELDVVMRSLGRASSSNKGRTLLCCRYPPLETPLP